MNQSISRHESCHQAGTDACCRVCGLVSTQSFYKQYFLGSIMYFFDIFITWTTLITNHFSLRPHLSSYISNYYEKLDTKSSQGWLVKLLFSCLYKKKFFLLILKWENHSIFIICSHYSKILEICHANFWTLDRANLP